MALPGRLRGLRAAPGRRELEARLAHHAPTPDEPEGEGIAELLDEAEDIVNAAGPEILAEVEAEQARATGSRGGALSRLTNRFRRRG